MSTLAKFSVVQYERMIASGAFAGKNHRRLELIRGELREMNPIGARHAKTVDHMAEWSFDNAPRDNVRVRVQNPVAFLDLDSEPVPDIVWAAPGLRGGPSRGKGCAIADRDRRHEPRL